MKKLTPVDVATIVKLRGLGFQQKEIADKLGVTGSAVSYQLRQIRKQALEYGIDEVFKIHCTWLNVAIWRR
ncbi:unnamed protein product [marine sediment metagenome]|uniref:Uncharacterized protein n=1 Tax=marine sediment metagenome TaxID=412755 RepID=X1B135_9ZZZZ